MSPYAYLPMLTHLVCLHTLTYQSSPKVADADAGETGEGGGEREGASGPVHVRVSSFNTVRETEDRLSGMDLL